MQAINITPVERFLQKEIDAGSLAQKLDDMVFDYTQYVLRNTELCGAPEVAEDVYWIRDFIRCLREVEKAV